MIIHKSILNVEYYGPLFFQISNSLVPQIEIVSNTFFDKNSKKQSFWMLKRKRHPNSWCVYGTFKLIFGCKVNNIVFIHLCLKASHFLNEQLFLEMFSSIFSSSFLTDFSSHFLT